MSNLYHFKKKVWPEWYSDSPVREFTRDEIEAWERESHPEIEAKLAAQAGMTRTEIEFLDNLNAEHVELTYTELMEGTSYAPSDPFEVE